MEALEKDNLHPLTVQQLFSPKGSAIFAKHQLLSPFLSPTHIRSPSPIEVRGLLLWDYCWQKLDYNIDGSNSLMGCCVPVVSGVVRVLCVVRCCAGVVKRRCALYRLLLRHHNGVLCLL